MAPLCRPDCAGLCPLCGVDLNSATCTCVVADVASPFDVLDQLRDRLANPTGDAN
ncbi:MAG: hypothetical protein ABIW84_06800 [Ilumatobacteraceae bacterium]